MTGQEFSRVSEYTDEMNPVSDFTKTENMREETRKTVIFLIADTRICWASLVAHQ